MSETGTPREVELTDPRALRGMAHPLRLALVGLLRGEGSLTATQAAKRLDVSDALCSFHLRQLAKYGLVEEAGGGRGRERPWRATALFTRWPGKTPTPELAAAAELLETVIATRYFEMLMAWIGRKPSEPPEWQEAAEFGDNGLYVTAEELAELDRAINALLEPYVHRLQDRGARPEGSRQVTMLRLAFPYVGPTGAELSGPRPGSTSPGVPPADPGDAKQGAPPASAAEAAGPDVGEAGR
jgi:DNA-binding transcriptional ArsR family regulator